jgi:hypothetical protein
VVRRFVGGQRKQRLTYLGLVHDSSRRPFLPNSSSRSIQDNITQRRRLAFNNNPTATPRRNIKAMASTDATPQRAPFPKDEALFHTDPRVFYSMVDKVWMLEDEAEQEWEWLPKPRTWVQKVRFPATLALSLVIDLSNTYQVDPELIARYNRETYGKSDEDESEPVADAKKRKAETPIKVCSPPQQETTMKTCSSKPGCRQSAQEAEGLRALQARQHRRIRDFPPERCYGQGALRRLLQVRSHQGEHRHRPASHQALLRRGWQVQRRGFDRYVFPPTSMPAQCYIRH